MRWIASHLLAALVGWGLIGRLQQEHPSDVILNPSRTSSAHQRPSSAPRLDSWQMTWRQKLRSPLTSRADINRRMHEMMTYFMEWMRADPTSALASFRQLAIPGEHNVLREGISAARPEDAEIIFREVQKLQGQGLCKITGALGELAGKVADQDPARALRLVADFPAGNRRAAIVESMLKSHSQEVGKELERLLPLQKELRQSPSEWKMIENHLQDLHLRNSSIQR